jgi:hypothetical protein
MKRLLIVLNAMLLALLLTGAPASLAQAVPDVTIELVNPPKKDLIELEVGQSYTFDIEIESDVPFVQALAMTDAYYPGRGVFWHGSDRATRATYALLHLAMQGKNSTAGLPAVCDWPEPGVCWPEGVAPVSIAVGVRYPGGLVVAERFAFAVKVP